MSKAVSVLLAIAGLCLIGVFILLKVNQSNANKARTAKAREVELERRAKVREEKANQPEKQPDLFSSADVENN